MPKQQYPWVVALAMLAGHQLMNAVDIDDDQEGPRLLLQAIYAQAGVFDNAPAKSANDQMAALMILLFIWVWNCAKYRALMRVIALNRADFFQINEAPFLFSHFAETRATWNFPNGRPFFSGSVEQCQMNTPLTLREDSR